MSDDIRFRQVGTVQFAEIAACDAHAASLARQRSADLARDVERFLAQGGQVEVVPITARGGDWVNDQALDNLTEGAARYIDGRSEHLKPNAKRTMVNVMRASVERAFAERQEKARG